jgi:transcriptional regulator with XRE-family HTH domain
METLLTTPPRHVVAPRFPATDHDTDRSHMKRSALAAAIEDCYRGRGLTQARLAELVGVDQSTISNLKRGVYEPTPSQIAALEKACDRPPGWVLRQAGFVAESRTVLDAIAVDPDLDDVWRDSLTASYEVAVKRTRANRRAEQRNGRGRGEPK